MLSMSIQPSIKGTFTSRHSISTPPSKTSLSMKPSAIHHQLKSKPRRALRISASAATEVAPAAVEEPQLAAVGAKSVGKPRLVLKFIWMEKNIGLALDQQLPGHGTVPLSPYFFWPRKDAWEELKATLESKPWVSQKKMIILLNQATDIINLWQQSGGNLS